MNPSNPLVTAPDQIQPPTATVDNRGEPLIITYPNTEPPTQRKRGKRARSEPNIKSINAISAKKLKMVLEDNATKTQPKSTLLPLQIDVTKLLPKFTEYTGRRDKLEFFLKFIASDQVAVCPLDNARSLKQWGEPKQTSFVSRLQRAAQNSVDPFIFNVQSWGKTTSALFQIFAKVVWPIRGESIKAKYRCLYGLRLKDDSESDKEEEEFSSISEHNRRWSMGSNSSSNSEYNRRLSMGPTSSSNSTPTSSSTGRFKPTYDILENAYCYIVRIILPLMNPGDAKRISIDSNLAQKLLNVSGSYIPGCSIGNPMSTRFSLRAPLLPLICAPTSTSGWFNLRIALPTDIKDDESSIMFTHSLWGIAVRYPRRKTVGQVAISFASCFGSCNFDTPSNKPPEQTPSVTPPTTVTTPATSPTDTPTTPTVTDQKEDKTHDAKTPTDETNQPALTKQSLINRIITVDGSLWSSRYKGRTYQGTLTNITRQTTGKCREKDVYTVKFVDCTEVFGLTDLRDFGAISEPEFDALNDEHQF